VKPARVGGHNRRRLLPCRFLKIVEHAGSAASASKVKCRAVPTSRLVLGTALGVLGGDGDGKGPDLTAL